MNRVAVRSDPRALLQLLTLATLLLVPRAASTQDAPPPPRVDLGFGVDTATADKRAVLDLWRRYLADRPENIRAHAAWSAAEAKRWPAVDLTAPFIYQGEGWSQGMRITVVQLEPAPDDSTAWAIRTLFSRASSSGVVRPIVLLRVYAVPEAGEWKLANALPRQSRDWQRQRVGTMTFVHPPGYAFSADRARHAAAFVDSLTTAFQVAAPSDLEVYLHDNAEELWRVAGLDFALYPTGRTYTPNKLLFSAHRAYGEFYPHELTHIVLAPISERAPWILQEGLATWLGGSRGRDFGTLLRELDAELNAKSWLTLDTIVGPHNFGVDSVSYTTGAVLLAMAHERGGVAAVRRLLLSGGSPDDIRRMASEILGIAPGRLGEVWRDAIRRFGSLPVRSPVDRHDHAAALPPSLHATVRIHDLLQ